MAHDSEPKEPKADAKEAKGKRQRPTPEQARDALLRHLTTVVVDLAKRVKGASAADPHLEALLADMPELDVRAAEPTQAPAHAEKAEPKPAAK